MADSASSTKDPKPTFAKSWDESADGHNGRRVFRTPNWRTLQIAKQGSSL